MNNIFEAGLLFGLDRDEIDSFIKMMMRWNVWIDIQN